VLSFSLSLTTFQIYFSVESGNHENNQPCDVFRWQTKQKKVLPEIEPVVIAPYSDIAVSSCCSESPFGSWFEMGRVNRLFVVPVDLKWLDVTEEMDFKVSFDASCP